jgi:hypothetical protein
VNEKGAAQTLSEAFFGPPSEEAKKVAKARQEWRHMLWSILSLFTILAIVPVTLAWWKLIVWLWGLDA